MSKKGKRLPEVLTALEIEDLRGTFQSKKRYKTVMRNYLMIEFTLQTGTRITECINTKIENVNWNTGQILLDKTKGGDDRLVFIHRELLQELIKYRKNRNNGLLFTTLTGQAVNRGYLDDMLKRKGARAEIRKRKLHFHTLRHTFAIKFYEKSNYDIVSLSRVLGHKSLNTTQIYLQGFNSDKIEKVQTIKLFD